jgi:hypothetical protein
MESGESIPFKLPELDLIDCSTLNEAFLIEG